MYRKSSHAAYTGILADVDGFVVGVGRNESEVPFIVLKPFDRKAVPDLGYYHIGGVRFRGAVYDQKVAVKNPGLIHAVAANRHVKSIERARD